MSSTQEKPVQRSEESTEQKAERARRWVASREGQDALRARVEEARVMTLQISEARRVKSASMQKPVNR